MERKNKEKKQMGLFGSIKKAADDTCKGYDKVKTNKKMTYEELYEVIKDGNFAVGKPALVGKGIMHCIQFPPVNKYLIQIAVTGNTITISKIYNGVGGLTKDMLGDAVTDGWFSALNEENIDLNRATRDIGEEISRLLKEQGLLKE